MPDPLLSVEGVSRFYSKPGGGERFAALRNVSFSLGHKESIGLTGESGAGKTTLTRLILGLEKPSEGRILLNGVDLVKYKRTSGKEIKRRVQIIWQDPYVFLNPYFSVERLLAEPLQVLKRVERDRLEARIRELLELVGLGEECLRARPHELSGGQCQRVAMARALAVEPELLICDEALASLDLLQQARMLDLLGTLREKTNISYLFISHDFAVLTKLCSKIAVLKDGFLVEIGSALDITTRPEHPYTKSLVKAAFGIWEFAWCRQTDKP